MSNTKYPVLSFISKAFRFFGWLNILTAGVFLLVSIIQRELIFLAFVVGILFGALMCFVFAEAIIVLVDIEYNTREKNENQQEVSRNSKKSTNKSQSEGYIDKAFKKPIHDGPLDELALLELNAIVNPLLSKLKKIGYEVVDSRLTKLTTYWRLTYTDNGSFCEFNSIHELQDFTKNF